MTDPARERDRARIVLNSHYFYGKPEQFDRAVRAMIAFADKRSAEALAALQPAISAEAGERVRPELPCHPIVTRVPMRVFERDGRTIYSMVDENGLYLTEENCDFVSVRTSDYYIRALAPEAPKSEPGAERGVGEVAGIIGEPLTGEQEAKLLSYKWAHDDAVGMGYPSLTEALEDLDRLRTPATPEREQGGREDFLTQLRRINTARYEAWVGREPLMLCDHCGRAQENAIDEGSTHCAPPFEVKPHEFTRPHPYLVSSGDAGIMFDAVELGGEVGELLNVVKKLEREERGWRGSRAAPEDFADECGDVLICLDKLARRRNVDLAAATASKFNATSDKVGLPHKLALPTPEPELAGELRDIAADIRAFPSSEDEVEGRITAKGDRALDRIAGRIDALLSKLRGGRVDG